MAVQPLYACRSIRRLHNEIPNPFSPRKRSRKTEAAGHIMPFAVTRWLFIHQYSSKTVHLPLLLCATPCDQPVYVAYALANQQPERCFTSAQKWLLPRPWALCQTVDDVAAA